MMLISKCNTLSLLLAEHVQHEHASLARVPHLSETLDLDSGGYRYCVLHAALLAQRPLKCISCRCPFHSRYSLALPAAATAAAQEQPSPLIKAVRPQELARNWEQALPGESERAEQGRQHTMCMKESFTATEKDAASEDDSSIAASLASPPQRLAIYEVA